MLCSFHFLFMKLVIISWMSMTKVTQSIMLNTSQRTHKSDAVFTIHFTTGGISTLVLARPCKWFCYNGVLACMYQLRYLKAGHRF